jgi:hypothetical protein
VNLHHITAQIGVFLTDHAVGALGDRRAGEDPGAFAGSDRAGGECAGGDLFDHAQRYWRCRSGAAHVGGPGGIAVHRGVEPGGNVEGADHVLGEDGVERVVEGDA